MGTPRLSIAEYKKQAQAELSETKSLKAETRKLKDEIKRLTAKDKLVRELLRDHDSSVQLELGFHPERKWRFDIALPEHKIALEIDGGAWTSGAHHRGAGRKNDNEKDTEAQLYGWKVFRVYWEDVINGGALALLRRAVREMR